MFVIVSSFQNNGKRQVYTLLRLQFSSSRGDCYCEGWRGWFVLHCVGETSSWNNTQRRIKLIFFGLCPSSKFLTKHDVSAYRGSSEWTVSLPEEGSKDELRNSVLHKKKLNNGQSEKRTEISIFHHLSS